MAPDGDEVWAIRSEPLFLKGVMSDFKSKHIHRWRSGSFLSPGPSNSKTVAGSPIPRSTAFSNEGDEPSRKPSTHQHRVCGLGSWLRGLGSWLRWSLIYPCILPPLPVLPPLRCAIERMQSSERMLERRDWRPLAPTALRCRGARLDRVYGIVSTSGLTVHKAVNSKPPGRRTLKNKSTRSLRQGYLIKRRQAHRLLALAQDGEDGLVHRHALSGIVLGRLAADIHRGGVGTGGAEDADALGEAVLSCLVQRRLAVLAPRVDVCAELEQRRDALGVAAPVGVSVGLVG